MESREREKKDPQTVFTGLRVFCSTDAGTLGGHSMLGSVRMDTVYNRLPVKRTNRPLQT